MPILALGIPVVQEPADLTNPFADSRSFLFRSLDGTNIFEATGNEFILQWGIDGIDQMPRDPAFETIPGLDGGVLTDIKIGVRESMFPIFLGSNSSHRQFLADKARLRAMFNHRNIDWKLHGGTFDVVATSETGTRSLRCLYVDRADGGYTQDTAGSYWESFGLKTISVRPYWWGGQWETPWFQTVVAADDFFEEFPPLLSPEGVIGEAITVTVPGEVESWPTIELIGPADSAVITAEGVTVSIPAGLGDGEYARIVTAPYPNRTVTFSGVKDWSRVGPNRSWHPFRPGPQDIAIDIVGATSTTQARVIGDIWYETPW